MPIISGRLSKLNNITLAKLVKSNGLIGPLKFYCNTLLEIILSYSKIIDNTH